MAVNEAILNPDLDLSNFLSAGLHCYWSVQFRHGFFMNMTSPDDHLDDVLDVFHP